MQKLKEKPASRDLRVIEGGHTQQQNCFEERIEGRLDAFGEAVEQFVTSLPAALLAEQSSSRELIDDLVLKQFALRWIVRAAKHSQGVVRQALWSDIDQTLAGLEKTLGLLSHFAFMHGHSRVPDENHRVAASPRWS